MHTSFSGSEFARRLADGELKEPIVKVGMVKPAEHGDTLLFSEGTTCGHWIEIPVELIEEATYLGQATCHDHQHALARLELKDPPPGDATAHVFAELARRGASIGATTAGPGMQTPDIAAILGGLQGCASCGGGSGAGKMSLAGLGSPTISTRGQPWAAGAGATNAIARESGGGSKDGPGYPCIVWHEECRTVYLYFSRFNLRIPIQICYDVCDTFGIPF